MSRILEIVFNWLFVFILVVGLASLVHETVNTQPPESDSGGIVEVDAQLINIVKESYCQSSEFLIWLINKEQLLLRRQLSPYNDESTPRSLKRIRSMIPKSQEQVLKDIERLEEYGITIPSPDECDKFPRIP